MDQNIRNLLNFLDGATLNQLQQGGWREVEVRRALQDHNAAAQAAGDQMINEDGVWQLVQAQLRPVVPPARDLEETEDRAERPFAASRTAQFALALGAVALLLGVLAVLRSPSRDRIIAVEDEAKKVSEAVKVNGIKLTNLETARLKNQVEQQEVTKEVLKNGAELKKLWQANRLMKNELDEKADGSWVVKQFAKAKKDVKKQLWLAKRRAKRRYLTKAAAVKLLAKACENCSNKPKKVASLQPPPPAVKSTLAHTTYPPVQVRVTGRFTVSE